MTDIAHTPVKDWRFLGRTFRISGHDDVYFKGIGHHPERDIAYQALLDAAVPVNCTILDIGANIGKTTIQAACCRPDSSIIAFEPGRKNFALLTQNIEANSIPNVTAVLSAVGNINADAVAFNENSAWGRVVPGAVSKNGPPCLRIDDYLAAHPSRLPISWVKIDVEGHEWEVVRGMEATIRTHNPVVFMEFNVWCLVGIEDISVLGFLDYLSKHFRYCYRLTLEKTRYTLTSLDLSTLAGKRRLIHDNIARRHGVEDIMLSNRDLSEREPDS